MPARPIPPPKAAHQPSGSHSHSGKPPHPLPPDQRYSPSPFQGPPSSYRLPGAGHHNNSRPVAPSNSMQPPPSYSECNKIGIQNPYNPHENHPLNNSFTSAGPPDNLRGSGRTIQSWNSTTPDDDGGSTTSGSYVVDSADLYMDEFPPVRGVVV